MKSMIAIFQHKYLFLTALSWGWFEVIALPKPMLLVFLFGAMIVDFITGLVKSWRKGESTTSNGFRRTVTKMCTYMGAIVGVWLLANLMNATVAEFDYTVFVNSSIGFLTFIEIYSIFENIYEIDPGSLLSKKFISPILRFLKGKLKDNPINHLPGAGNDLPGAQIKNENNETD